MAPEIAAITCFVLVPIAVSCNKNKASCGSKKTEKYSLETLYAETSWSAVKRNVFNFYLELIFQIAVFSQGPLGFRGSL